VAADDRSVLPASEHGLDEPELAQAPLQRVELVLADAPRVGRIWAEVVDGDLLDDERGERRNGQ